MGIEDRDYVRGENRGGGMPGDEYPAVRMIIFITVVVYLCQIFITRPQTDDELLKYFPNEEIEASGEAAYDYYIERGTSKLSLPEQWFQLDTNQVKKGQVWRLLTSAFCHDRFGIFHILVNMIVLLWFGRELETIYGSRAFTWFYITAAIFSALTYLLIQLATGERIPAIGASGAVMAVMMVYAIFHPRDEVYVFFVIPIQIRFLLVIFVLYDLHPVLLKLSGNFVPTGIAHSAHLGGLMYGYIFWRTGYSLMGLWDRTSSVRSKVSREKSNDPRVIPMQGPFANSRKPDSGAKQQKTGANQQKGSRRDNDGNLDQQVDDILAKISESGRESLSKKELDILEQASQKYSNRSEP